MSARIIHVLGATCCGKSTLIERAAELYTSVGVVQVGKELRRRHPPEYFQGKGMMEHTEAEARAIYQEQIMDCVRQNSNIILVDGNPRSVSQLDMVNLPAAKGARGLNHLPEYWWIDAMHEDVEDWMERRFADSPSGMQLARDRINNDRIQMFSLMHRILWHDGDIETILMTENFNYAAFFLDQGFGDPDG